MLVAFQGKVISVRRLTDSGFSEVTLEDTTGSRRKATGEEFIILKNGESIVIIGEEKVHAKYGPQTRAIKWWLLHRCPFKDIDAARRTLVYLYEELKIPPKTAQNIFEAYGERTIALINENPYLIATEGRARRVGIKTIDKYIAPRLNITETDPRRLRAQIMDTIKSVRGFMGAPLYEDNTTGVVYGTPGSGHLYIDFTQLVGLCADQMELSRSIVAQAVRRMALEPRNPFNQKPSIVVERDANGTERYVYSYAVHAAERGVATHIKRIHTTWRDTLSEIPISSSDLVLSDEQRRAIVMALSNPVSIITGGPGVGKTTIIKALTESLSKAQVEFALCAPTGVASRRMVKATGQPASTVHRLLAIDPSSGEFMHNRHAPLSARFIICDESSMMPLSLMYSLLDAVQNGSQVVFVGDVNQLPPVSAGAPFRELIEWGKVPVTKLHEVRRQELADSLIIKASRDILDMRMPTFSKDPKVGDLFAFSYASEPNAVKMVCDLVMFKIQENFGIQRDNIQVLCPHRSSRQRTDKEGNETIGQMLASDNINPIIQKAIHGQAPLEGLRFMIGDRVIHNKNNYNLDVMNGEIGYVRKATLRSTGKGNFAKYVVEYADNKNVTYEAPEDVRQLDLAYALSTHKSQGSEFEACIVIAYAARDFYSRNMLYTAITRGKKVVIVLSPKGGDSFKKILSTKERPRNSRLVWRLENEAVNDLPLVSLDELSDDAD